MTAPDLHDLPMGIVRVPVGDAHGALVDAADLSKIGGVHWRIHPGANGKLYAYARAGDRCLYMHRIIADTPPGCETDHINGDGLDNRRCNLRVVTPSQNRANAPKRACRPDRSPYTSQYKGVCWDKSHSRWQAKITFLRRCASLGRYASEEEAARAYDRAAIQAWGSFAVLNFPDEETP